MMPKDRPFIDKYAEHGRPYLAPYKVIKIKAKPFSKSLSQVRPDSKITAEVRTDGYLVLNVDEIVSDRIKINKTNAIKFALWILGSYDN